MKHFALPERVGLAVRAEIFKAFNRDFWNPAGAVFGQPQFGVAAGAVRRG